MLTKIEEYYKSYKEIYNNILPDLDKDDRGKRAKCLLENSLYLSVFTTFEKFLKDMIDNYVYNIEKRGIKFTELSEGFARSIFLAEEKRIRNIFDNAKSHDLKAFESYFDSIKTVLSMETLKAHIRFEFLHENKINGYYKNLFQQMLGGRDFLGKIRLKEDVGNFDGLISEVQGDASTFLCQYTSKIRNSIAHENESFIIGDYSSFDKVVDAFYDIICEIADGYEEHTGFSLTSAVKNNILDEF